MENTWSINIFRDIVWDISKLFRKQVNRLTSFSIFWIICYSCNSIWLSSVFIVPFLWWPAPPSSSFIIITFLFTFLLLWCPPPKYEHNWIYIAIVWLKNRKLSRSVHRKFLFRSYWTNPYPHAVTNGTLRDAIRDAIHDAICGAIRDVIRDVNHDGLLSFKMNMSFS